MTHLQNQRIMAQTPLPSPKTFLERFPISEAARQTVLNARQAVADILEGKDPRKLLVVGPCSIHDPKAAIEYAHRLKELSAEIEDQFLIIMRAYFEKPRTTVGWKGLINDPDLNDTFDIEKGLGIARKLLIEINELGIATGTEALDPISPQYFGDLISWYAIGARTSESQTHREMSSGLSAAVGFKNGTDGSLDIAINAIEAASKGHSFLGIDLDGKIAITRTSGNPYGHIVLRGGDKGPNYDSVEVALCEEALAKRNLAPLLLIDCSHANSNKDPSKQPLVFKNIIDQLKNGNRSIIGMMLESHLFDGAQKLTDDASALRYGVSITDGCIGWETTEQLLKSAAACLRER